MKRGAPILILLVFLIMGITIFWIFRSEGGTKPVSINPFAAATATPEPTATPSPTAAPTATPVPTATPSRRSRRTTSGTSRRRGSAMRDAWGGR